MRIPLADRVLATTRNAVEVARFGGLETGEEGSPYEVVAQERVYRLRRYFSDSNGKAPKGRPAVVLVPPLMLTAEVYDVSIDTSAVGILHELGIDPWVVDFGRPDREPGGLERTLTDHVLAVSEAVDCVRKITGRDVVLSGYSQGGMFSYQAAAYRHGKGIDSLVTFGSPVDTHGPLPLPIPTNVAQSVASFVGNNGLVGRALPAWGARSAFRLIDPVKSTRSRISFLMQLHDREALLPRERQRRFIEDEGWTAYPGPAIAELMAQFVAHNRMLEGGFVIDERLVTLADIDVPILTFVGETDTLGPPVSVRAIRRAAPSADVYEVYLRAGHFGLVVGSSAAKRTWPNVAAWAHWRDGKGELPEEIKGSIDGEDVPGGGANGLASLAGVAVESSADIARAVAATASRTLHNATELAREGASQLPRLTRLEQIRPNTRISMGLLLDEQAEKDETEVSFLYKGRAHRRKEAKYRIDSVVKGLTSIGVRRGDRVGVLMDTRPSGFATVAALNRLGATAVLLRPDGDPVREARLGRITWLITDPEHTERIDPIEGVTWAVLGGGAKARKLRPEVIDMERIDPEKVTLPAWYRANPQRGRDLAFVLFTGEGELTRPVPITNLRWAMSALGTASAARLGEGDTVYSITPIHHSSAVLMSIGGAIAGGARLAIASGSDYETFWEEVRRYGVTHVSYTWTSLRHIAHAPPDPREQHHPIRLFIGSGMPIHLWRRINERFAPARVLEFYASTEGESILANVAGRNPGSMGLPLPGTAEVRVAKVDPATGRLAIGDDGLAREADTNETGLLLARVDPNRGEGTTPMFGVFKPGDAWRPTGDLFKRDEHGEFWLVDPVSALIPTPRGAISPAAIRFALGELPQIDLVVVYGCEGKVIAALTLLPGEEVSTPELNAALMRLDSDRRPDYVTVVKEIPVTTWHRPITAPLRAAGIPKASAKQQVWRLGKDRKALRAVRASKPKQSTSRSVKQSTS